MRAILSGFFLCVLAFPVKSAETPEKLDLGAGVTLEVVPIPAGSFTQGSPATEPGRAADESPREVRISRDFLIGRTPITRSQWERFIADTGYRSEAEGGSSGGYGWNGSALEQRKEFTWRSPGFPQTADHPVCLLTYPDAEAFCKWLSTKTRRAVTLPTEAQWEYACRVGTTTPWHGSGPDIAWHKDNAGNGTRPVDSKPANPWGLAIAGNVSEWCLDWYAPYPAGTATDPRQDNPNLSDKPRRVLRGGSWLRGANNTRSAARYRADPRSRNADTGFRIVCSAALPPPPVSTGRPPVEAETDAPGEMTAPPPVTIPDPQESAPPHPYPSPGSPLLSMLKGLLCLGTLLAIVFYLIRRAVQSKQPPPSPDNFLRKPSSAPNFTTPVRKSDDGFWVHGDWPEGTALTVRYVIAGTAMVQEILYRPGQDGQFIFTGRPPDSVSVVVGSDPSDSIAPQLFGSSSTTFDHRRDDDDNAASISRSRPPTSPSAY